MSPKATESQKLLRSKNQEPSSSSSENMGTPTTSTSMDDILKMHGISVEQQTHLYIEAQMAAFKNEECEHVAKLQSEISMLKDRVAARERSLAKKSESNRREVMHLRDESAERVKEIQRLQQELVAMPKFRKEIEMNHTKEIQSLKSDFFRSKQAADDEKKAYKDKIGKLEKDLKEAVDKIFRLQPYTQDVSFAAANYEYNALCEGVVAWVERILDPILDNEKNFNSICTALFSSKHGFALFQQELRETDLVAMAFEDTDIHVVVAVIMRILHYEIFGSKTDPKIFGVAPEDLRWLGLIEQSMGNLIPRRDFATIRSWRNETYLALSKTQHVEGYRSMLKIRLTYRLAHVLEVFTFLPKSQDFESFANSIRLSIIEPAVALHEKLSTDTNCYFFEDGARFESLANASASLAESIDELQCSNVLAKGKKFRRENLRNGQQIQYLCTMTPALMCHQVREGSLLAMQVVTKPRVLVAVFRDDNAMHQRPVPKQNILLASMLGMEDKRAQSPIWRVFLGAFHKLYR